MKKLAEAIIFQATVDYYNGDGEDGSFFSGEGFRICSDLAGMSHEARCAFLTMIRKVGTGKGAVTTKRVWQPETLREQVRAVVH